MRLNRISPEKKDFKKHIGDIKSWYSQKGYPERLIEPETSKVKLSVQRFFHRTNVEEAVLLVVKYHPLPKTFGKIIHEKLYLLYMNKELDGQFYRYGYRKNLQINHKFDCIEKRLIYLLTCNKYRKQYVGQTVDTFRYRWNNYRSNSRMAYHACKNICTNIFVKVNIVVFLMTSQ